MRLGQLARKLSTKPSQLVDILAANNILAEGGINTRLDNTHIHLIVQSLAPDRLEEITAEANAQEEVEVVAQPAVVTEEPAASPEPPPQPVVVPQEVSEKSVVSEIKEGEIEVIKAPKVELQGLKVLGKIELPEVKKKEPAGETPESPAENSRTQVKRTPSQRRERTEQRPYKNPIAAKREQEALEAERKKKEHAEREKEKRTQNYLKRVKSAPTKAAKYIDEQASEVIEDEVVPPKTWLGKLFRWFKS